MNLLERLCQLPDMHALLLSLMMGNIQFYLQRLCSVGVLFSVFARIGEIGAKHVDLSLLALHEFPSILIICFSLLDTLQYGISIGGREYPRRFLTPLRLPIGHLVLLFLPGDMHVIGYTHEQSTL